MSSPVVVGRQAVQDREGVTVGYELLFRADRSAQVAGGALSGDEMSAAVALSTLEIGLDEVVGGRLAFVNADRGVLLGDVPLVLPPDRAVVEVLETVVVDVEVLAGCRRLADQGYAIALDDFVGFEGDEALLDLADIVKIDVRQTQGEELVRLVERCRRHGVRLLAEKVETAHEYDDLSALGFDLFQGYYVDRPVVVAGPTLQPGDLSQLRMATLLLGSELELEELVELLHFDPSLAVQVIRLAALGRAGETRRTVTTIRDAVLKAGSRAIQSWMALLVLRPGRGGTNEAPGGQGTERFVDVLVRARAVELLCARHDRRTQETAFAAGMLSALDLLLGVPAAQLRDSLELDEALAQAAFGEPGTGEPTGPLGRLVRAATDFQLGRPGLPGAPVTTAELETAFADAFVWTAAALARMSDAATSAA
ncbi:EAL and HDOD domain-containing protein [Lapillicoccus jejuensis]|uniref:EAL and modified HD-GYP domain-containing signal transduction protein n=1 Tax=Lapillicoccus jejuensis TaxID=402171 RepID=A0A542E1B7_9MICO|nr:EAL domain-containing protein [Lapillicoccus jejuensis]TQJ09122.1 EAL and modified HD-GYP domain-containing signal transduction protein [Lapillicoccus jejuensis]